ncbi:MAG: cytochrome c biogenesis protein CcsA [Acidobacteria bacterium]|nr:cytochrome c biogenesis protein CcsA [Acidobacteriota bacterium]
MPVLWLRVALALYSLGLVYSVVALGRQTHWITRFTAPAVQLGMIFHFVSLLESAHEQGRLAGSFHDVESLLAFMLMLGFSAVYVRYRTVTPGILIFPAVFLLTFAAAMGKHPIVFTSPLRKPWIAVHITLVLGGYAALLFSLSACLLYLLQERGLKSKSRWAFSRLPALDVIDQISYRSLLLGFPFMTLGLVTGIVLAEAEFGAAFLRDPKILLSLLMWAVYIVLLYTRWSAGWRGRRAALLASVVFVAAIGAWAANSFSSIHRFTR